MNSFSNKTMRIPERRTLVINSVRGFKGISVMSSDNECFCCIIVVRELELFMWGHVNSGIRLLDVGKKRNVCQD